MSQPLRVILDSRLRIPLTAKVCKWTIEQPTMVMTTAQAPKKKIQQLQDMWDRRVDGVNL